MMQKVIVYEEKQYNDIWKSDIYWYTWDERGRYHITEFGIGVDKPLSKKQLSKLMANIPQSWLTVVRSKEKKK